MNQSLFVVYFIYGLSFFGMGLAILLESGRSSALAEARTLRSLAAFGLIHGTHEWLESYLLQAQSLGTPLPTWLPWLRLFLLASSFGFLFLFAYRTLKLTSGKYQSHIHHFGILFAYMAFILTSAVLIYRQAPDIPWFNLLDGLARYLLAIPAAILATLAFRTNARRARESGNVALAASMRWAMAGFGVYGLAQFFARTMAFFPASLINENAFLSLTGFPIQVVRTVMAVIITIGLLRAMQLVEAERQKQLVVALDARLEAFQQQEAMRRDLLRHTVRAQEEERARISRELHDEAAQLLSAFSLELAALQSMLKGRDEASIKVERLQALSRDVSQELYRLVHDLRPVELDDLGLAAALNHLVGQYRSTVNADITLAVKGEVRRLDPLVETILFRVAQEGLNNVIRHAHTRSASLQLNYEGAQVHLSVADQGQGFDTDQQFAAPRGWGLAGMKERVESIGGVFNLRSAPGAGTVIEVCISLVSAVSA